MFRLQELEIIQLFRQPGGAAFAEFYDELIRATAWAHGVPQSEISIRMVKKLKRVEIA
jgi:hypothetical protein